jgi:hypothetical protein
MPMDIIFQGVPMKMRFESQLSRINCQMFSKSLVSFYNKRGNCKQWIKQGKGTIKWTRLSCRPFPGARRREGQHRRYTTQKPLILITRHAAARHIGHRTLIFPKR